MTLHSIIIILFTLPQFPLMGFFIGRFIRAERLWAVVLLFTVPIAAAYSLTWLWPAAQWPVTLALSLAAVFYTAKIPRWYAAMHLIIGVLLMNLCTLLVTMTVGLVTPEYARWADMPLHISVMLQLLSLSLQAMVWMVNNRLCGILFHLETDSELRRYTPFLVLECAILLAVHLVTVSLRQTDTLTLLFNFAVIVGFIFLDVLLINTVRRLDRMHNAELKQQQTLELLRNQADVYRIMQKSSTAVRRLRHDMVNQLQSISYLLKNGDSSCASAQLHAYLKAVSETEQNVFTGNPVADAVIRTKTEAMADAGIDFSCTGILPEHISVAPDTLCTAIFRLLDNAVRGCCGTERSAKRSISLRIGIYSDRLVLRCENTGLPDPSDTESNWNLNTLRRIAEANDGHTVFEHRGGIFTAIVQFRIGFTGTGSEERIS